MIERFSSSYYIGEFIVEEYSGDEFVLPVDLFQEISHQVYGDPITPVVLKVGGTHIVAVGEQGIPADTVAVPSEYVSLIDVALSERTEVLVARKERAVQISKWVLEDYEP